MRRLFLFHGETAIPFSTRPHSICTPSVSRCSNSNGLLCYTNVTSSTPASPAAQTELPLSGTATQHRFDVLPTLLSPPTTHPPDVMSYPLTCSGPRSPFGSPATSKECSRLGRLPLFI
ncbi:hypothetical protein J6590_015419 [Homalodisca vitripennis]|nr:hypothetical protein J6590_015419 [Homalodisca vitripennis]